MRAIVATIGMALVASQTYAAADVSAAAIIREINLARQNPGRYANFLEQRRQQFSGKFYIGGTVPLLTHEGIQALDEAIAFLGHTAALHELQISPGLSQAAADHCRDQAAGRIGHRDTDRNGPADRINRYGTCSGGWAEDLAYGQQSARDIVIALIVDDGVRSRGHRKNIFNPVYKVAGAASGPHAKYGTVCSIDFAAEYSERTLTRSQTPPSGSKL